MKNLILGVCTMFALTTATFAQNAPATTVPAKAKEHGKEMKVKGKEAGEKGKAKGKAMSEEGKAKGEQGQMGANLGLSTDQQAKYGAVNKAHQDAVRKIQMDKSLTPEAKKTQVDALKSKYDTDVKGVMNADQYAKWSANRTKRAENKAADKMQSPKVGDKKMSDHKTGDKKMGDHKMGDKKPKAKTDAAQPQSASKAN